MQKSSRVGQVIVKQSQPAVALLVSTSLYTTLYVGSTLLHSLKTLFESILSRLCLILLYYILQCMVHLSLLDSTTVKNGLRMTPFYSSALYHGSTLLYSTLAPLDFTLLHSIMSLLDAATLPYYIYTWLYLSTDSTMFYDGST